jgi:hypothetical protein
MSTFFVDSFKYRAFACAFPRLADHGYRIILGGVCLLQSDRRGSFLLRGGRGHGAG